MSPNRLSILRLRWLLLAALLAVASRAPAGQLSTGNLNLPASRLSDWYAPNEAVYQASRSWPEYDVSCGAAPCPSGKLPVRQLTGVSGCQLMTPSNGGGLDCFVDNAVEQNIVLWVPNGSYPIANAITVARSNIVVRGQSRTGTILRKTTTGRNFVGGSCDANTGSNLVAVCNPSWNGSQTSWTAGYAVGTTTVTLSNTSGFTVGGWILLRMSGSTSCSLMDKTLNAGGAADGFVHIAKVTAKTASSVTIDRALRMDYAAAGCSGHSAVVFTPVVNVGIERMRLTSDVSIPVCGSGGCIYFPHLSFVGAADSWLVDAVVDRAFDTWMQVAFSRGVWVQGSDFDDLDESISFGTAAIYLRDGANDSVIENNTCRGAQSCNKHDNGSEGNVTAYNYLHVNEVACERAVSLHGHYVRAELVEGNDLNCELQAADTYWGRNGPFITIYRNRNTATTCRASGGSSDTIGLNDDGLSGPYPAAEGPFNMVGNTSGQFHVTPTQGTPACPPSAHYKADMSDLVFGGPMSGTPGLWLEKNAWRVPGGTFQAGGSNNRSCGTGANDACPGTNKNTNKPDPSWTGSYPVSLYRTAAPSWWCQEACPWSTAGIGAFGDDFSKPLCKLPAEIRSKGLACTPLSGSPSPPPPAPPPPPPPSPTAPAAPTLLP